LDANTQTSVQIMLHSPNTKESHDTKSLPAHQCELVAVSLKEGSHHAATTKWQILQQSHETAHVAIQL